MPTVNKSTFFLLYYIGIAYFFIENSDISSIKS